MCCTYAHGFFTTLIFKPQCIAVFISAGRTSVGIKGCWRLWVCVTDKRQRAALLFYLSLRWCHTEDCVLQHSGGCRRLDPCLRYTTLELESREHSGRIMRECVWTILPFKKSITFEGPVRLVTFKRCKCWQWVKGLRIFFLSFWEMKNEK